MSYRIGVQDLVSNALIELVEQNGTFEVSFDDIYKYGEAVVKIMAQQNITSYLVLSREQTDGFVYDCSDILEVVNNSSFRIKAESDIESLKIRFRDNMSFDVLKACINPESLKAIKINAA